MTKFQKIFKELEDLTGSSNTSCKKFTSLLTNLGFQIVNCGSAGHKIAMHPAIDLPEYPNFNCGHNQGAVVKRVYINKIYKFVERHKEAIKEHLK
jgi:hypothetical protein